MISFYCPECGQKTPWDTYQFRCTCGSPWEIDYTANFHKSDIQDKEYSIWRYKKALPFRDDLNPVSLGEGWTPLLTTELDGRQVFIKPEWMNPTGSFKDRGVSAVVSFLKMLGIPEVMDDSSGNAGASLAAYSAYNGIDCHIFAPAYASGGKVSQIKWYGADLNLVEGTRSDVFEAILKKVDSIYYASHNFHPIFFEGIKTLAYEICEQTNWQPPDNIVIPLGYGGLYLGLQKGFIECSELGLIRRVPRVHGIQAELCSPLHKAFKEGLDTPPVWHQSQKTMAEGIAAAHPFHGKKILNWIRKYKGSIEAVNEEEIVSGLKILAQKGLFVEPTSAVVVGGLNKLITKGVIKQNESVLLVLTGFGLKAYHELDSLLVQK